MNRRKAKTLFPLHLTPQHLSPLQLARVLRITGIDYCTVDGKKEAAPSR